MISPGMCTFLERYTYRIVGVHAGTLKRHSTKMKILITILLISSSQLSKATEQRRDLLIFKSDTIYIDKFPLEILSEKDIKIANQLDDTTCLSTDCWRQHIGIWKIENDSLFLIGLKDCCDFNEIPLNKVFSVTEIQKGKVFANWYSENINAGFGEKLGFSKVKWEIIYDKNIVIDIINGRIEKCVIEKTKLDKE